MTTLITSAEALALAFEAPGTVDESFVSEAVIISAERKFLRPVLGGVYEEMLAGGHADLLDKYVKLPLALYVKWMALPQMSARGGNMGVVQLRTGNFSPAGDATLSAIRKRIKSDARALMLRAVEHVESSPALYPGYDPEQNILKRNSIAGGIIL